MTEQQIREASDKAFRREMKEYNWEISDEELAYHRKSLGYLWIVVEVRFRALGQILLDRFKRDTP